jgi:hypothetical protein
MQTTPVQVKSRHTCKSYVRSHSALGAASVAKIFCPNTTDARLARAAQPQSTTHRNEAVPAAGKNEFAGCGIYSARSPAKSGPSKPVYADAVSGVLSCYYSMVTR